jgi:hypothetical protein
MYIHQITRTCLPRSSAVLVIVKWMREGGHHKLHRYVSRRAGGDLGDVVNYSEFFWSEHYQKAASVPWGLVAEDFIISTASARPVLWPGLFRPNKFRPRLEEPNRVFYNTYQW